MTFTVRSSSVLTFLSGVIVFHFLFDWIWPVQETRTETTVLLPLPPPPPPPPLPPHVTLNGTARPNIVYGHIHIAKTAGTTLNGRLASHFDRVCGNKGYSLDIYQYTTMQQINESGESEVDFGEFNRGRVHSNVMNQIGFEDCDYISQETVWAFWQRVQKETLSPWNITLELHVPCRDPLEHLMSQCNYRERIFNCDGNIGMEVNQCLVFLRERFSRMLLRFFPNSLKCFEDDKITEYVDFMKNKLHQRRIPFEYKHRSTNKPRNKERECIWYNTKARIATLRHLMALDYYKFCSHCMPSNNNLLSRKLNESS